jgi:hypothetical protein
VGHHTALNLNGAAHRIYDTAEASGDVDAVAKDTREARRWSNPKPKYHRLKRM